MLLCGSVDLSWWHGENGRELLILLTFIDEHLAYAAVNLHSDALGKTPVKGGSGLKEPLPCMTLHDESWDVCGVPVSES